MDAKNIIANEIDGVYCLPGVNDVTMAHDAAEKAIAALNTAGYRIIQFRVVERAPLVFDLETPPFGPPHVRTTGIEIMDESVEIPDGIKQTATRFAGEYLAHDVSCDRLYRDVARLLLAERERCAQIAESFTTRAGAAVRRQEMRNG